MRSENREMWGLLKREMCLKTWDTALGTALSIRPMAFAMSKHINVFLACINMYCLRGKDRKRLKTHTPYIGISNIMTSLHLCPWIVVQSMHPGPQAPSRPW